MAYWEVTLLDGHTVEVWADGYQELDGAYVFSVLADVGEEQQKDLFITGRTPTDEKRVIVGLSRFPRERCPRSAAAEDLAQCRIDRIPAAEGIRSRAEAEVSRAVVVTASLLPIRGRRASAIRRQVGSDIGQSEDCRPSRMPWFVMVGCRAFR